VRLPPPLLGEHNDEVLCSWLRMNDKDIAELRRKKII